MHSPLRPITGILVLLLLATLAARAPLAQTHPLTVRVVDEHSGAPLPGATVVVDGTAPAVGATAGSDGLARLAGVPAGDQTLVVSFVGFETVRVPLTVPLADPGVPVEVALEENEEALGDVVVSATRTSRTIANVPTRVETIAGEEIDEKTSMEPSNITMLLNESPGIVVQQTSAVSGNASIRIQGLDGRYTQLLKDGFPLYGGFAGGLSLLQVPPLDLRQVEVIKGPASTLYGGDAIAGLVNLVSQTPGPAAVPAERSVLFNGTSAGGLVRGAWSRPSSRVGVSSPGVIAGCRAAAPPRRVVQPLTGEERTGPALSGRAGSGGTRHALWLEGSERSGLPPLPRARAPRYRCTPATTPSRCRRLRSPPCARPTSRPASRSLSSSPSSSST